MLTVSIYFVPSIFLTADLPYTLPPIITAHKLCQSVNASLGDEVTLFCPCSAGEATSEIRLEWFKWVEKMEDGSSDGKLEDGQWIPVLDIGDNGTTYTLSEPQKDIM